MRYLHHPSLFSAVFILTPDCTVLLFVSFVLPPSAQRNINVQLLFEESERVMKKLLLASAMMCAVASQAAADIKVGVLHSLSGTMAISETTLKDTMLMLIEQQNAKGGLLGEKLVPVVVDPAYPFIW